MIFECESIVIFWDFVLLATETVFFRFYVCVCVCVLVDESVFACSFVSRESLGKQEIEYLSIGLFFLWNMRYQKPPWD